MTYNEWFESQQGVAYDSMWSFARVAWGEQENTISLLRAELAEAQSEAMKYKLATEKNANALREVQRDAADMTKMLVAQQIEHFKQLTEARRPADEVQP